MFDTIATSSLLMFHITQRHAMLAMMAPYVISSPLRLLPSFRHFADTLRYYFVMLEISLPRHYCYLFSLMPPPSLMPLPPQHADAAATLRHDAAVFAITPQGYGAMLLVLRMLMLPLPLRHAFAMRRCYAIMPLHIRLLRYKMLMRSYAATPCHDMFDFSHAADAAAARCRCRYARCRFTLPCCWRGDATIICC